MSSLSVKRDRNLLRIYFQRPFIRVHKVYLYINHLTEFIIFRNDINEE